VFFEAVIKFNTATFAIAAASSASPERDSALRVIAHNRRGALLVQRLPSQSIEKVCAQSVLGVLFLPRTTNQCSYALYF
jgi:hypothetical protein